ncbi:TetR/AcrR family transcriptional regulator [Actinoplanes sp. NPDC051494]|uniref:TetR/AcrR family transcriptional regulator n=1 Tax=Actinoplanes sp. NPDC051494 TaxID=3363907 RepID=UPI0037A87AE1
MDNGQALTRRERLRSQTLEEIRDASFAIIDADGGHALSIAALARSMAMSAPAVYRYFPSRDALMAHLTTLAYEQLTTAMTDAVAVAGSGRAPQTKIRFVVEAYRGWALRHPRRYAMLFGEQTAAVPGDRAAAGPGDRAAAVPGDRAAAGSGNRATAVLGDRAAAVPGDRATAGSGERAVAGSGERAAGGPGTRTPLDRAMALLIDLMVAATEDAPRESAGGSPELDSRLKAWARIQGRPDITPRVAGAALLIWTRVHGIVGLELTGMLDDHPLDAEMLINLELDSILDPAGRG